MYYSNPNYITVIRICYYCYIHVVMISYCYNCYYMCRPCVGRMWLIIIYYDII